MANLKADSMLSQLFLAAYEDETDRIANLANAAAVLMQFVPDINWAGFYLLDEKTDTLLLGPFQGLPATTRIDQGKGVVGTAFIKQEATYVPNVHQFAGHIACDPASNSEIVLPLTSKQGKKIGVLDIDSKKIDRFDTQIQLDLTAFTQTLLDHI
ncbi:GAF domain-containing protein [Oenococcus sicerae]|uniref:GAF domain-containing protein n=1 Tax=Oenococcus sicerae TaxID=2203724 RepID=A0AAJ1RC06_9LACO|nr:GAF domain-containing protein [Oenococcus sicerae]MDN6900135.1 GAF domain-containing protein [Oenococcus sicerae]QAS69741.1 GAF domain-containing protein [Oenococcus sicerae]